MDINFILTTVRLKEVISKYFFWIHQPVLIGLGEGFPQPGFSPGSSGSPQPEESFGFPQAAVPLSTVGLVGEVPPQPDGPTDMWTQT